MSYNLFCAIIWFAMAVMSFFGEFFNLAPPSWLLVALYETVLGLVYLESHFDDNNWRFKN